METNVDGKDENSRREGGRKWVRKLKDGEMEHQIQGNELERGGKRRGEGDGDGDGDGDGHRRKIGAKRERESDRESDRERETFQSTASPCLQLESRRYM